MDKCRGHIPADFQSAGTLRASLHLSPSGFSHLYRLLEQLEIRGVLREDELFHGQMSCTKGAGDMEAAFEGQGAATIRKCQDMPCDPFGSIEGSSHKEKDSPRDPQEKKAGVGPCSGWFGNKAV